MADVYTEKGRALVYGAGKAGYQVYRLNTLHPHGFTIVGYIDDDPTKKGQTIGDVAVLGDGADVFDLALSHNVACLIIAMANVSSEFITAITTEAEEHGLTVFVVPPRKEIIGGRLSFDQIRAVNLDNLLGRLPVDTDLGRARALFAGKTIAITGAGGSIGSGLARSVSKLPVRGLCLIDRDESALHALELAIEGTGMLTTAPYVLCDIRDRDALAQVFDDYRPDIVLHAAALKHVPMLERFPEEAWKTNVLGTLNVLSECRRIGVEAMINISTDKAANPTTVLGHTKQLAERLTAAVAGETRSRYVSVRFGNVLGSRGSVIHTFAYQIEQGGPVTVTGPDVERYFMTVDEACQLVLQAAAIGEGGQILILEMDRPVKIDDIAKRMIADAHAHVPIVYTGLRPGEKLSEDLISDDESATPTECSMISSVAARPYLPAQLPASYADYRATD